MSERGVLGGEIPRVVPHPDFRAFLLYDPSKGEVSRAMRNRGVEVHLGKELTSTGDLFLSRLGTAAASERAIAAAEQIIEDEDSLQSKLIQVSVLAQDTLCGGKLDVAMKGVEMPSLLLAVPDTRVAGRESSLWRCLFQMRTLLHLLKEGVKLGEQGFLNYLHFATEKDLTFACFFSPNWRHETCFRSLCSSCTSTWTPRLGLAAFAPLLSEPRQSTYQIKHY